MRKHTRRLLATSHPAGDIETIGRLGEIITAAEVDVLAVVGNLIAPTAKDRPKAYRRLFEALGRLRVPTFFVPGPRDAPLDDYLHEAYNLEVTYPMLHGVHGTLAFAPGYLTFAGMGGEIVHWSAPPRDEYERLRYPDWEVEYRLKILSELKDYRKVFLFDTPPAHKGWHEPGSELLATLIKTHAPIAVIVGGKECTQMQLGSSLVVAPGQLSQGDYRVIDLKTGHVETGNTR